MAANGVTDLTALPRGAFRQLATAFEVQVVRKDKEGIVVRRTEAFDSHAKAEKYANQKDADVIHILRNQSGFEVGYEAVTVRKALERFHLEHCKGKASFKKNGCRIAQLSEWLGATGKFRDLTIKTFKALKKKLQAIPYSASSPHNYFTVLTFMCKHAIDEWEYLVANLASGMKLPRPDNCIQRDWRGDEKSRLMKSIQKLLPWLLPIVAPSLQMSFRRGELTQSAENTKTVEQSSRIHWENAAWERDQLTLSKEKNDASKKTTESLERAVPLTSKMREISQPIHEASTTKRRPVFQGTINLVRGAFSNYCKKAEPPIEKLTFHSARKNSNQGIVQAGCKADGASLSDWSQKRRGSR